MSAEARAWSHACLWATTALLRAIQVQSAVGIVFCALGVTYSAALVALTWTKESA